MAAGDVKDLISLHQPLLQVLEAQYDLRRMPVPESNKLFQKLLLTSWAALNLEAVKELVYFWGSSNPEEDVNPIASLPFGWVDVADVQFFEFYVGHNPSKAFYEYMATLVHWPQDPTLDIACLNLDRTFGPQPITVYRRLVALPATPWMRSHLERWIARASDTIFAPIPSWIRPVDGDPIPTHEALLAEALQIHQLKVDQLLEGLDVSALVDGLGGEEAVPPPRGTLRPLVEARFSKDPHLFRLFGPCWITSHGADWLDTGSDDPCAWFGGHRLLLCVDSDVVNSEGDDIYEDEEQLKYVKWFSGRCDFCYRKIRAMHHSFRMPLTEGGWLGTYCSAECTRQNATEGDDTQLELIDLCERELIRLGIYDRRYEAEIIPVVTSASPYKIPIVAANLEMGRSFSDSDSEEEDIVSVAAVVDEDFGL